MYTATAGRPAHRPRPVHALVTTPPPPPGGNVLGMDEDRRPQSGRVVMSITRVWLPLTIALVGVVLIVIGHGSYSNLANTHSLESGGGVALLLVALCVW